MPWQVPACTYSPSRECYAENQGFVQFNIWHEDSGCQAHLHGHDLLSGTWILQLHVLSNPAHWSQQGQGQSSISDQGNQSSPLFRHSSYSYHRLSTISLIVWVQLPQKHTLWVLWEAQALPMQMLLIPVSKEVLQVKEKQWEKGQEYWDAKIPIVQGQEE